MDPRTGLGRWRNFSISNYQLMEKLIDACHTMDTDEIMHLSDVQERIDVYFEQTAKFKEMLAAHTRTEQDVILSDLRGVDPSIRETASLSIACIPSRTSLPGS